jgi:hypothetical protein
LTALAFLTDLAERLEIIDKENVGRKFRAWMWGEISWALHRQDTPEIM